MLRKIYDAGSILNCYDKEAFIILDKYRENPQPYLPEY